MHVNQGCWPCFYKQRCLFCTQWSGKKATGWGEPTSYGQTTGEGTGQDAERGRPSEGCTLWRSRLQSNISWHGKKGTKWGALTLWRLLVEGHVRTWKGENEQGGAHKLGTAEGLTNWGALTPWRWQREGGVEIWMESNWSNRYTQVGDCRGRGKSGCRMTMSKQGALTLHRMREESSHREKENK